MSIESATYINDLQPVNPPSTDPRSQGDDHLRLIKQVLQNQFTGASRAWQIPGFQAVSGTNFNVTKAMGESIIFVNTSVPLTIFMPALTAADQGWKCQIMKYSGDTNPLFVNPSAGTNIQSGVLTVTRARRCIPGVPITVWWNGSGTWFVSRATSLPIGSLIDFYSASLPPGYEWPNGQTLVIGNYPEYAQLVSVTGVTPDLRGCAGVTLDNLGGVSRGMLPNGFIAQTSLGAVGGADGVVLSTAQMPSHFHSAGISDPGHTHTGSTTAQFITGIGSIVGGSGFGNVTGAITINAAATGVRVNSANGLDTTYSAGGGGVHSNLQPSIMLGKIMVVE